MTLITTFVLGLGIGIAAGGAMIWAYHASDFS